jgi:hypothetical protein
MMPVDVKVKYFVISIHTEYEQTITPYATSKAACEEYDRRKATGEETYLCEVLAPLPLEADDEHQG